MNNENYLETYFYLSIDKLIISVFQKDDSKKIYTQQLQQDIITGNLDYPQIEKFLEENIFQIEKITKTFLNEVYLVINHNESLPVGISLKINNDRNIIREKDIDYLLIDAKQQIRKNFFDRSIIHMIINNYLFDGVKYNHLPKELNCDNFSLDLKFICLSNKLIKDIEFIFQKHQVFIREIICAKYTKEFFHDETLDIFEMTRNIQKGYNENEIILVPRKLKKKGIFERFFHFFG
jgi:hypothetical protein